MTMAESGDVFRNPGSKRFLADVGSGEALNHLCSFVVVRSDPFVPVAGEQLAHREVGDPLVAVGQRVVPYQAGAEHCGLGRGIGVEVGVTPPGKRRGERRVGGSEVRDVGQVFGVDLEHGFRNEKEVIDRQSVQVLPRYRDILTNYTLRASVDEQVGTSRSKGSPRGTKAMTLRLPAEQAAELEAVARADQTTVTDAVREAIDKLIAERRRDKEFQARLRTMMQEDRKILERLAR